MKLEKRKDYKVEYWYFDKNGVPQEEVDVGIKEEELEQVVENIVNWVHKSGGKIDIRDIDFTEQIFFTKVD